jgi:hypothetical protein
MASQSPFAVKSGSIGGLLLPAAAILGSVAAYGFFSGAFGKHSHAKLEIREAVKVTRSSPLITKIESVPIAEIPEVIEPVLDARLEEEPELDTAAAPVLMAEPLVEEVPEMAEPLLAEPVLVEPVLEPKSVEFAIPEILAEVMAEAIVTEELPVVEVQEEVPEVHIEAELPVLEAPKVVLEGPKSAEETFEQYRQAMLTTGPRDLEYQARVEMQTKGGMANNAMWRAQTASLRRSLQNDDPADFLERSNFSVNDRVLSSFHASRGV